MLFKQKSPKLIDISYKNSVDRWITGEQLLPEASPDGHSWSSEWKAHCQALGKVLYANSNRKISTMQFHSYTVITWKTSITELLYINATITVIITKFVQKIHRQTDKHSCCCCSCSFRQGSSLLWTHTLRPFTRMRGSAIRSVRSQW